MIEREWLVHLAVGGLAAGLVGAVAPSNATLLRDLLHSTAHASEAGTEGDGHG